MVPSFQLKNFFFITIDQLIQVVLFHGVRSFEFPHFLSVLIPQFINDFQKICNLFIFKSQLGIEDLKFGIFT